MKAIPLSKVGKIITGKTPSTKNVEYFCGNTPFITPSDMDERRIIERTGRYLSEAGVSTVKNCVVPAGSVMVSCIGSDMGKTHIAGLRSVTNQQINSIVVDQKNYDPLFVYYNLFGRRKELRDLASGAAQPILNKTEFGKVEIDFPKLEEQREIAAILGSLDDKIELNRKTAATLEEMARALYRSWFVVFDPVRAKAEGREPAFMDAETAALFPDSFGDDGLPVGWMHENFQDLIRFNSGKTWPDSLRQTGNGIFAFGANGIIGESTESMDEGRVIFIGKIGSCGALNYFSGKFWATNNTYYVTKNDTRSLEYARFSFHEIDWKAYIGGSSNPYMPLKNFNHLKAINPGEYILDAFEASVSTYRQMIEQKDAENVSLATLRDTLLPRLMSGELRVGEAREQVEAV